MNCGLSAKHPKTKTEMMDGCEDCIEDNWADPVIALRAENQRLLECVEKIEAAAHTLQVIAKRWKGIEDLPRNTMVYFTHSVLAALDERKK